MIKSSKIELWIWRHKRKESLFRTRFYLKKDKIWYRIAYNMTKTQIHIIKSSLKNKQFNAMKKMYMLVKVLEFNADK